MKQEVTSSSPTALLYGVGPLSQEHRRDDKVAQETTARPPGSAKADHKAGDGFSSDHSSPLEIISFRPVKHIETIVIDSSSNIGSPTSVPMNLSSSSSDMSISTSPSKIKHVIEAKGKEGDTSSPTPSPSPLPGSGVTPSARSVSKQAPASDHHEEEDGVEDEWLSVAESFHTSAHKSKVSSQTLSEEVFATPMDGIESGKTTITLVDPQRSSTEAPEHLQKLDSGNTMSMDISTGDSPPDQDISSSTHASPTPVRGKPASMSASPSHTASKQDKSSALHTVATLLANTSTPRGHDTQPSDSSTPYAIAPSSNAFIGPSTCKPMSIEHPPSSKMEALSVDLTAARLLPSTPPRQPRSSPLRKHTTSPSSSSLSDVALSSISMEKQALKQVDSPSARSLLGPSSPLALKRAASSGITTTPNQTRTGSADFRTRTPQRSAAKSNFNSPSSGSKNRPGFKPHSFVLEVPLASNRQASASPISKAKHVLQPSPARAPAAGPVTRRRTAVFAHIPDSDDSESENDTSSVKSTPHRRAYDAQSDTTHEDTDGDPAFEAAMERVRIRKENNEMLVLAPSSSSMPIAAVDSGIDVSSADQPRRSSRVGAGAKKPAVKKPVVLSYMDVKPNINKGQYGLAAIVKERQDKERSGKSSAWLQSKQLLADDDHDFDRRSDSLDDEEATKPNKISLDQVDCIANVAAEITKDDDAEYAQYMASPKKREQAQAAEAWKEKVARTLREDAARIADNGGVEFANASARCFWTPEARVPAWQSIQVTDGASPWFRRIARVIEVARGSPQDTPSFSSLRLFSRVAGYGQVAERRSVARLLLLLVCQPATSDAAATRAIVLLDRMIRHTSTASNCLLSCDELESALASIGRKAAQAEPDALMMQTEDADKNEQEEMWNNGTRTLVVRRLLSVAQSIAGAGFASELCPAFVTSLLALACDPSAAPLRDCVEATLATILSTLDEQELSAIATSVTRAYRRQGPQAQLEVLRILPHDSQKGKLLRKCIASAWLMRPGYDEEEVSLVAFDLFAYDELRIVLQEPSTGSAFHVHNEMDDRALYMNAQIFSIALTNLEAELYGPTFQQARLHAIAIASALADLEKKIRTNVRHGNPMRNRAKNALTRLSHSLVYQLRASGAAMSGFDREMAPDVKKVEDVGADRVDDIMSDMVQDIDKVEAVAAEQVDEEMAQDVDKVEGVAVERVDGLVSEMARDLEKVEAVTIDRVDEEMVQDVKKLEGDAAESVAVERVDGLVSEMAQDVDKVEDVAVERVDDLVSETARDVDKVEDVAVERVDDLVSETARDVEKVEDIAVQRVGDILSGVDKELAQEVRKAEHVAADRVDDSELESPRKKVKTADKRRALRQTKLNFPVIPKTSSARNTPVPTSEPDTASPTATSAASTMDTADSAVALAPGVQSEAPVMATGSHTVPSQADSQQSPIVERREQESNGAMEGVQE